MQKNTVILSFIVGIAFRLFIVFLVPQPFVYDQIQYRDFARHIIEKGIHADTYRLYGFPLIMVPFVYLTDVSTNKLPWIVFQAILDTTTAILVFSIARKIFSNRKIAATSFLLYLFNPFTSVYVGVFLSEIVSIFLLTLVLLLILLWFEKKTFSKSILLAFLLGFLPQVRPVFLYFDIFLMILLVLIRIYTVRSYFKQLVVLIFLFIVPFFYTMFANKIYFDEITPFSVDNVLVREIYTSLFIERSLPTGILPYYAWPPEVLRTWGIYSSWNKDERYRNTHQFKKYAMQIISGNPGEFIFSRIRKMWYVWEKHYLYTYIPGSRNSVVYGLVYGGNIILLASAMGGLIFFLKGFAKGPSKHFGYLILFFFFYVTVIHIFSTSEERFSLPAYPLLFVFAGFFFSKSCCKFCSKIMNYL